MNGNKIIFEVAEDEESSSATYIAVAFCIVTFAVLMQMFISYVPGFG